MSQNEIKRVFTLQKKNQRKIKATTADERIRTLVRLKDALIKYRPEVNAALAADLGRKQPDDARGEIGLVVAGIDHAVANLAEWMKPTNVPSAEDTDAMVRYEPRGTVLLFTPWNFPIDLLFEPLTAIVAAGNTCIVKTNEMTPEAGKIAAKIIQETFDEAHVAVFEGDVSLANELLELPFDHFFLTGSPRVGQLVMTAAAKHLASVTLELGGKCPAVIDKDYPMAAAAPWIAYGATMDMGQTCQCVDYVVLPKGRFDEFKVAVSGVLQNIWYKDGEYNPDAMAHFVNLANFKRVKGYMDEAVARGAEIALGGRAFEDKLAIEPTLLRNVPLDTAIMQNEIFGTVIPVIEYEDIEEVYDFVDATGKPLNLFVYSNNATFVEHVVDNISAGNTNVNSWVKNLFNNDLPFGGVNKSGTGRYHGVYGFRELSNQRAMVYTR
ncbi:aldehyde dehydrogenase family protein [Burkholderia perseverans]|uniref:aldehyde dehydrogenase family protein n=1 Tax=Burkholderia perseverans TaxID=2615214 RepID=UPI001FEF7642|nr:aldehyde dehydrogenase family protein [Burkholderia perseverans]